MAAEKLMSLEMVRETAVTEGLNFEQTFCFILTHSNTLAECHVSFVSCPVGHFLHLVKLCFLSVF